MSASARKLRSRRAQRLADERVEVAVALEPLALALRRRRHVADAPLADDLLRHARAASRRDMCAEQS